MSAMVEEVASITCWQGEEDRELRAYRYCECGTCQRGKPEGAVGMISGSDLKGRGFTIEVFSEAAYKHLFSVLGGDA